jgi:AraC-like DNA-binding protein
MNIICHESPLVDSIYPIASKRYLQGKPFSFIGAPAIQEHIILNDGCAEIRFDIGGETFEHDGPILCGKFMRVPKISIRFLDPSKDLTLIRLNSYGLSHLSGRAPSEFVDRVLPLAEGRFPMESDSVDGFIRFVDAVTETVPQEGAYAKTVEIVEHILENFSELPRNGVHALSQRFRLSESTLRRYFKRYLGISLSDFLLTIKRRKMVQALFENEYGPLSVCENGYYDQSHFLNDFRRLYGIPLKQFIRQLRVIQEEDQELMRFLYHCNIAE